MLGKIIESAGKKLNGKSPEHMDKDRKTLLRTAFMENFQELMNACNAAMFHPTVDDLAIISTIPII